VCQSTLTWAAPTPRELGTSVAKCPFCRVEYSVGVTHSDGVTTVELECHKCGKKRLVTMREEHQVADCEAEIAIPVGVTRLNECTLCGKFNSEYPRDTLCPSCRFEVVGRVHGVNGHHSYQAATSGFNPSRNSAMLPPCSLCGEPNTRTDLGLSLMKGLCIRCMCEQAASDDGDGMAARHLRDIIAE
jgi:hypothetical protein